MADGDIATRMIDALRKAPSLQLNQMRAPIGALLADSKRTMPARASLHLGQAAPFADCCIGQICRGKFVARHDTQAAVLDEAAHHRRCPRRSADRIVKRINRRNVTQETMDGRTWRADYQLLPHVVEV